MRSPSTATSFVNWPHKSIEKLNGMRRREGQSLFNDLMKHTKLIAGELAQIQTRAPFVIDEYHKKLLQRVNQLMSKAEFQVNQVDLLKEIAVFAERADISEEIQRLTHHLDAFEQACRTSEHAGKKAGLHHAGNAARGQHDREQGE